MTIPVLIDSDDLTNSWAAYADGVRFLALRKLGDADAAADIAQETVLRALRVAAERPGELIRDPSAFVYGIARHLIADAYRARNKTVSLSAADSVATPERDHLQSLISEEERGRVRHAIAKLSVPERTLLVMSFVRGMSSPEIASRLGESADGVRKRKSRAVQRLREAFFGE